MRQPCHVSVDQQLRPRKSVAAPLAGCKRAAYGGVLGANASANWLVYDSKAHWLTRLLGTRLFSLQQRPCEGVAADMWDSRDVESTSQSQAGKGRPSCLKHNCCICTFANDSAQVSAGGTKHVLKHSTDESCRMETFQPDWCLPHQSLCHVVSRCFLRKIVAKTCQTNWGIKVFVYLEGVSVFDEGLVL